MSQQTEQVKVEEYASNKALWCLESTIAIFGTELVSEKFINLLRTALKSEDEHGVNTIRFTEDLPKVEQQDTKGFGTGKWENELGDYDFESRSIVINLAGHFENAWDRIVSGTKVMRVQHYIYINMLITVLHEILHGHKLVDSDNPYELDCSDQCAKFDEIAKELITELAKTVDIEPPALADESPIIAEFIQSFEADAMESDDEWAIQYRELIEKNLVYKNKDEEISTLRLYYKRFAQGGGDASDWPEEVHTVTAESFKETTPASVSTQTVVQAIPAVTPTVTPVSGDEEHILAPDFEQTAVVGAIPLISNESAPPVLISEPTEVTPAIDANSAMNAIVAGAIPPAITVQQQQTPAQQINSPELPLHQVTVEQKLIFIRDLSLRMYDFMFGYCGFAPNPNANPAEPWVGFTNPNAVYQYCPVHDIPFAKELLHSVRTHDEQSGQEIEVDIWNPAIAGWPAGHIRGLVWTKGAFTAQASLPGYVINFNLDGVKARRSFLPQNPNKRYDDGNLKKWAQQARGGTMRAMLLDDKRPANDKMVITVTTLPDGSKLREVVLNPLNATYARIL